MNEKDETQDFMLNLRISRELNEELNRYARKVKISKSRLIRNIIESSVDELRVLDRLGVLWMAGTARGFSEAVKTKLNEPNQQQQLEL